jgi:hypothetical protein
MSKGPQVVPRGELARSAETANGVAEVGCFGLVRTLEAVKIPEHFQLTEVGVVRAKRYQSFDGFHVLRLHSQTGVTIGEIIDRAVVVRIKVDEGLVGVHGLAVVICDAGVVTAQNK